MKKLILVRHAVTDDNELAKLSGHIDSRVSEEGKIQIEKLTDYLKSEKIDEIYTTTSSRTKDTVKYLAEINKIDIVDFFYKEDINSLDQKVGFIADDTDAIFSTRFQNKMDISNCVGMLLKAVQELSAEIKKLKS